MRLFLPFVGLVLVASGIRAYWRSRSTAAAWYALCFCTTCVALALWPAENSVWLDRQAHVVGLGRGIGALATWIAQACMYLFTLSFTKRWLRRDALALLGFGVLFCVEFATWAALEPVANSRHLIDVVNHGYHGDPIQLLLYNILYGASAAVGFSLGGVGYLHVLRTARDRHSQVNAWAGALAALDGVAYGILVAMQAVASWLDLGAGGMTRLMPFIVVPGVVAAGGFTWAAIYGRPIWRYLHDFFSLRHREQDLRSVRRDLLNAIVLLSDRLVWLQGHADVATLQDVSARCATENLSELQRRVAEEATRWIMIGRAHVVPGLAPETGGIGRDEQIAADVEWRAEREHYFYADVYRVVVLVLGEDRPRDLGSGRSTPSWHPVVATIIRDVLEERSRSLGQLPSKSAPTDGTVSDAIGGRSALSRPLRSRRPLPSWLARAKSRHGMVQ